MKIPEYVTKEEVRRVCSELKISDWTKKQAPEVFPEGAETILALVNKESMDIEVAELEGDLLKAVAANNSEKTSKYYKKLAEAKIALSQAELKRLN